MKKGTKVHRKIGTLKWCWACKNYKEASEFHKDRCNSDGLHSTCKVCQARTRTYSEACKIYQHQYYLTHRETLLPKHRITATQSRLRKKTKREVDNV